MIGVSRMIRIIILFTIIFSFCGCSKQKENVNDLNNEMFREWSYLWQLNLPNSIPKSIIKYHENSFLSERENILKYFSYLLKNHRDVDLDLCKLKWHKAKKGMKLDNSTLIVVKPLSSLLVVRYPKSKFTKAYLELINFSYYKFNKNNRYEKMSLSFNPAVIEFVDIDREGEYVYFFFLNNAILFNATNLPKILFPKQFLTNLSAKLQEEIKLSSSSTADGKLLVVSPFKADEKEITGEIEYVKGDVLISFDKKQIKELNLIPIIYYDPKYLGYSIK